MRSQLIFDFGQEIKPVERFTYGRETSQERGLSDCACSAYRCQLGLVLDQSKFCHHAAGTTQFDLWQRLTKRRDLSKWDGVSDSKRVNDAQFCRCCTKH
jgi:hypothetical protein